MLTSELRTDIEQLAAFAAKHGELAFAHLCTAALEGEEWAVERIHAAIFRLDWSSSWVARLLAVIRTTDACRPDGAITRTGIDV